MKLSCIAVHEWLVRYGKCADLSRCANVPELLRHAQPSSFPTKSDALLPAHLLLDRFETLLQRQEDIQVRFSVLENNTRFAVFCFFKP